MSKDKQRREAKKPKQSKKAAPVTPTIRTVTNPPAHPPASS
jgi:hypothetical protein